MKEIIEKQAAIDLFPNDALEWDTKGGYIAPHLARRMIEDLPPAQPDTRLGKIADLVDGSIDHFDLEDAMDLLYQIKDVLNG